MLFVGDGEASGGGGGGGEVALSGQVTAPLTALPGPVPTQVAAPSPFTLFVSPALGSDSGGNGNLFNPYATYAKAVAVANASAKPPSAANYWTVVFTDPSAEDIALAPFVDITSLDPTQPVALNGAFHLGAGYTGSSFLVSGISNVDISGAFSLNFTTAPATNTLITFTNCLLATPAAEGNNRGNVLEFIGCTVGGTTDFDSCAVQTQECAFQGNYAHTASVGPSSLAAYGGTFTAGLSLNGNDGHGLAANVVGDVIGVVALDGPLVTYASSIGGIGTGITLTNGAPQPTIEGSGNALAGQTLIANGAGQWAFGFPQPTRTINWMVLNTDAETTVVTLTPPLAAGEILDVSVLGNMSLVSGPSTTGQAAFSRRFYGIQNVGGTLAGPTGETTDQPNIADDIGSSLIGATLRIAIAGTSVIVEAQRPPGVAVYVGVTVDWVRGVPAGSAVLSASPASAPTTVSSPLTITVALSSGGTGATAITVDGHALTTVNVVSDTEVTGVLPAGTYSSGTGSVVVSSPSSPESLPNGFSIGNPPTLATIANPFVASAAGGQVITLTGTNLTGVTGVTVDGVAATGISSTGTSVTFSTPAVAESMSTTGYNIVVTTPDGSATLSTWGPSQPGAIYILDSDVDFFWYAPDYDSVASSWTDLLGGVALGVPVSFGTAPTVTSSYGSFSQPALTSGGSAVLQNQSQPGPLSQPFSVFAACSTTSTGNYQYVWCSGTSTLAAGIATISTGDTWVQAPGNGIQTTYALGATPTLNEWYVDGASSATDQENAGAAVVSSSPGANGLTGLTLFNVYNSVSTGLIGSIGFVALVNGTPSANCRTNLEYIKTAIYG